MRTRTLLILAVVCGLAILVAGGVRLLSISDDTTSADLPIGATAAAGDAAVTVLSAVEADGRLVVEVRIGGVDDPDGLAGFVLLAGAQLPVDVGATPSSCAELTIAETTCDLAFDVSGVVGDARVLRFRRGEDEVRWSLASRVAAAPG
jgi:hypothetical protein